MSDKKKFGADKIYSNVAGLKWLTRPLDGSWMKATCSGNFAWKFSFSSNNIAWSVFYLRFWPRISEIALKRIVGNHLSTTLKNSFKIPLRKFWLFNFQCIKVIINTKIRWKNTQKPEYGNMREDVLLLFWNPRECWENNTWARRHVWLGYIQDAAV